MQSIILLHGALGTKKQFSKLIPLLSERYDVHCFNFEGHGDCASEKEFSIDLFTNNLRNYCLSNKLENTILFGYSMGGYVALNYAKQYPNSIARIITYATKFDWTPESALKETGKLNPEKIQEKVPQFASFLEKSHTSNDWKVVMQKTVQMMLDLGSHVALSIEDLQQIETPILVGVGSNDTMVSVQESEFATTHLKNAALKIIEGGVHPFEQNEVEVFLKLIN